MKIWVAVVIVGLVGLGLVVTGMVQLPSIESVTGFMQPAPSLSLPRVELKSLSSEYGFLQGGFVISNSNAFPIAGVAIRCEVHEPSGAVVHTFDFVIDEPVNANGQKTISNYKFGFWPQQSSQMICQSISAERR
jgi:hypothetical protein